MSDKKIKCNNCHEEVLFYYLDKEGICNKCRHQQGEKYLNIEEEQMRFIDSFSWGGFLLSWIWILGSRLYKKLWIVLLLLIPIVNILVRIFWLGFGGRKMAWEKANWENFQEFKKRQKSLDQTGIILFVILLSLTIIAVLLSE